jgi:hypothetical protein
VIALEFTGGDTPAGNLMLMEKGAVAVRTPSELRGVLAGISRPGPAAIQPRLL